MIYIYIYICILLLFNVLTEVQVQLVPSLNYYMLEKTAFLTCYPLAAATVQRTFFDGHFLTLKNVLWLELSAT